MREVLSSDKNFSDAETMQNLTETLPLLKKTKYIRKKQRKKQ